MTATITGKTATDITARATQVDTQAADIANNFRTNFAYQRGMTQAQLDSLKNFLCFRARRAFSRHRSAGRKPSSVYTASAEISYARSLFPDMLSGMVHDKQPADLPVCYSCGAPVRPQANFCGHCGVPISRKAASLRHRPPSALEGPTRMNEGSCPGGVCSSRATARALLFLSSNNCLTNEQPLHSEDWRGPRQGSTPLSTTFSTPPVDRSVSHVC
jgi:hypothetical protein